MFPTFADAQDRVENQARSLIENNGLETAERVLLRQYRRARKVGDDLLAEAYATELRELRAML